MQHLTEQMYTDLLEERNELLAAMKLSKDTILKILVEVGLYDAEGNKNEKFNMAALLPLVLGAISSPSSIKTKFQFVADVLPLLEKYKDL